MGSRSLKSCWTIPAVLLREQGRLFGVVFDGELGLVFVDDGTNTLNVFSSSK
jgi:hypothetical protein